MTSTLAGPLYSMVLQGYCGFACLIHLYVLMNVIIPGMVLRWQLYSYRMLLVMKQTHNNPMFRLYNYACANIKVMKSFNFKCILMNEALNMSSLAFH